MVIPTHSANGASQARPKVLIPEKVSPDGLQLLQENFEVVQKQGLSAEELKEIIGEYEALVIRSETKVTADLLSAAKNLKVVARAGVGVDNVDVQAATKQGVIVVNSPVGNINAAAEHTIALMLATARNVAEASASIKAGKWERSKLVGVEMKGKTLSIVGAGKVGLTVARIAIGMGMKVIAYDPYANPSVAAAASVTLKPSLDDLLTGADFFTIHTPLIASTKGMIGKAELAKMKPTARVMNVARGGMIDEEALLEALNNGTIAGAGMDVFTSEPPKPDDSASRLVAHPKVVATPHLGASTKEAQENVSVDVCEQVVSILSGQLPRSAVNAPIILPEEYRTLQPFVGLVEKMGSLYTQHYNSRRQTAQGIGYHSFRTTFDITYSGSLASLNTTKPLFAALIKGLLIPISSPGGLNVNIVNAELVADERGIVINEHRERDATASKGYSSLLTLRARASEEGGRDHIIQGFVTAQNVPYISRLGRFSTNIIPAGTLLICRNFDNCGKIGYVGMKLGAANVNIKFMSVAPLDQAVIDAGEHHPSVPFEQLLGNGAKSGKPESEALMILGVDRPIEEEIVKGLIGEEGVLEASVVSL